MQDAERTPDNLVRYAFGGPYLLDVFALSGNVVGKIRAHRLDRSEDNWQVGMDVVERDLVLIAGICEHKATIGAAIGGKRKQRGGSGILTARDGNDCKNGFVRGMSREGGMHRLSPDQW